VRAGTDGRKGAEILVKGLSAAPLRETLVRELSPLLFPGGEELSPEELGDCILALAEPYSGGKDG
jgi:hypothetical protein